MYLSAAKNKMVSMRFLTEIIKLFIDSRNRREDWVVLVPKLSFFHREAVVQDFGGKESVVLTVVLENHGRSLARVSSVQMIVRAKVEEGMPFEELPVEILPLKKDSLKEGVLEIRGKEQEQIRLSDRDLRELINRTYSDHSRKLKVFKDPTRERGLEISVKSNMDGRNWQKTWPFAPKEIHAAGRMLDLALKEND